MYVERGKDSEYLPPEKRPKENAVRGELVERLREEDLFDCKKINCIVYSIFRKDKIRKFYDRDKKRIKDTQRITGFPTVSPKWEPTGTILRLYSSKLNCFLDYDIRNRLWRENRKHADYDIVSEGRIALLEFEYIGKEILLDLTIDYYSAGRVPHKRLSLTEQRFDIPEVKPADSPHSPGDKRKEIFGEEFVKFVESFKENDNPLQELT